MKRHATICGLAAVLLGMTLLGSCSKKPAEEKTQTEMQAPPAASTAEVTYVCPMHADVTSKEPGKCSQCGMDLVQAAAPESTATQAR